MSEFEEKHWKVFLFRDHILRSLFFVKHVAWVCASQHFLGALFWHLTRTHITEKIMKETEMRVKICPLLTTLHELTNKLTSSPCQWVAQKNRRESSFARSRCLHWAWANGHLSGHTIIEKHHSGQKDLKPWFRLVTEFSNTHFTGSVDACLPS